MPHEPKPVIRISSKALIVVCGQAPGARVHASGLPFDDPSGDRLRDWMGLDRAQFYNRDLVAFVPMGLCFPGYDAKGSDMPPRRECSAMWRKPILDRLVGAKLLLLIGRYAQRWHLGPEAGSSVSVTLSRWREIFDEKCMPRRLVLPHPSWRNTAWLRRNPWFEADVVPALRAEVARLADAADYRVDQAAAISRTTL